MGGGSRYASHSNTVKDMSVRGIYASARAAAEAGLGGGGNEGGEGADEAECNDAFATRVTQSIGVSTIMGIPHTPIPTLG